ncbi:IS91 family transposase [Roseimaritima sediminicola]|uniref:IS91 family transposase n=1 Tax=Roseimaritima sediminicola TaxID=2662066 RepID=UPI001387471D|nr:transposase [Roseimaritima sediminicola]
MPNAPAVASRQATVHARPRVVNVLRRHLVDSLPRLSTRQRRVLRQLSGCRRGSYGSRSHGCAACDHGHVTLNSCGNRHCPCCGDGRRDGWKVRMSEIALDVPYLHVVFTTPHELNAVHDLPGTRSLPIKPTPATHDLLGPPPPKTTSNDHELIRLLFDSAITSLKSVLAARGIDDVGAVMTLHTWGQRLNRHVHLHVVLIAGGIGTDSGSRKETSVESDRWVSLPIDEASLRSLREELATVYRSQYTDRFRRRVKARKIRMPGVEPTDEPAQQLAAGELTKRLMDKSWIVDLQASPAQWSGSEGIVNYLASYVAGTAISDHRMVSDDDSGVTIKLKDYRTGERTTETMPGAEFVERFASHILPRHSRRIRYVGLFAPKGRHERLKACRRLIALHKHAGDASQDQSAPAPADQLLTDTLSPEDERRALFTGEDNKHRGSYPARCRMCKRPMQPLEQIDGRLTLRILPYLVQLIAWLSGKTDGPPEKVPLLVPDHLRAFVAAELKAEQRRQQQATESIPEHPPP